MQTQQAGNRPSGSFAYPADMHLHTTFSCDASASMETHVKNAVGKGLQAVCFTDHYDANPADEGCGFYNPEAYLAEASRLQDVYGDRIRILRGLEFAEPHRHPADFERLRKHPYDFILGSVHWLGDFFVLQKDRIAEFAPEALEQRYYEESEAMTAFGGFDAVAHLDYLRRGTGRDAWPEDMLRRVFSNMVKNHIALEINTQHVRRGLSDAFPTPALARLYAACGGARITFGSDGHHPPDTGSGIAETVPTYAAIPGLVPGIFIRHVFTPLNTAPE
jgi:histidinol-phosphatase (PHP family)